MIEPQSLINIVQDGLNDLIDSDKRYIKYHIKQSETSISLYIYKTLPQTGQLYILRVSDHLPLLQKMVRGTESPRPSPDENANVSVDFYKPRREVKGNNETGKVEKKRIRNNFDNYVGVPANIPEVQPFTVSSYEYFYKNLEQSDELIIWHSIATWVCCLDPNKEFHDPFVTDENKKAKAETKTAEVHVFGDKIEIIENKTNKNMKNAQKISLNEAQLRGIIKESVKKVLNELDWKTYANAAQKADEDYPYFNDERTEQKRLDRIKRFRRAAVDAFNRDFGYDGNDYFYNRDPEEWHLYPPQCKENPFTGRREQSYINRWGTKEDYPGRKSAQKIDAYWANGSEYHEPKYKVEPLSSENPWLDQDYKRDHERSLKAANKGNKETSDYVNGNYEYVKGKGWQLKK